MLGSLDPKLRSWDEVKKELHAAETDDVSLSSYVRWRDSSICLNHGFHHQKSYTFRESIRCFAYRSNEVVEEFIINYGTGCDNNVLHFKSFRKDNKSSTRTRKNKTVEKEKEEVRNKFPTHAPPLQHIVYISRHRLFAGICSDKNLRVYSDTVHRCQILSAPTSCPMPVLSMIYLEETDEVVTGGLGVIQPWKIRLSNYSKQEKDGPPFTIRPNSKAAQRGAGLNQTDAKNVTYGQGRQMLQPLLPYPCDLKRDDWVLHLRVYIDEKSGGRITRGSKSVLVATCADAVVVIDYIKRKQVWIARLESPVPTKATLSFAGDGSVRTGKDSSLQEIHSSRNTISTYTIRTHSSITRCEFFPRFGYFITGGGEGTVQILNLVNFGVVTMLYGHSPVTGLAAHSDHPILISASRDGVIKVWCLETFRENQRIDTGQYIQNVSLSENKNFFYFQSRKMLSLYLYYNMYTLFSIPPSTAAKLCHIQGDSARSVPGKILAPLSDGAIAIMSPLTGILLTMIYPMTTFQIFTDLTFDLYSSMCYIRLGDGGVLQCDCSTNPCTPLQCFRPSVPYDEDVCSIASLRIQSSGGFTPVMVLLGGLCNGQIVLIRPNNLWMLNVQAHDGPVRFLVVLTDDRPEVERKNNDEAVNTDKIFSMGASSIRIWEVSISSIDEMNLPRGLPVHDRIATRLFHLQPVAKVLLPAQALGPVFVAVLKDRVCLVKEKNQLMVLDISNATHDPIHIRGVQGKGQLRNSGDGKEKSSHMENAGAEDRLMTALDRRQYKGMTGQASDRILAPVLVTHVVHVYTHHQEDDHVGQITALVSAQTLRLFVSASDDGYVKIWDDANRLVRELCFAPKPVYGVTFVNGRDLLVSSDGRLYAVSCLTYVTKQITIDRDIVNLNLPDESSELAFAYDPELKAISNIELMGTNSLIANERQNISDSVAEANARRLMTPSLFPMKSDRALSTADFGGEKMRELFDSFNKAMLMRSEEEQKEKEEVGDKIWRSTIGTINRKIKRGSIAIFADEEKMVEFMKRRERRRELVEPPTTLSDPGKQGIGDAGDSLQKKEVVDDAQADDATPGDGEAEETEPEQIRLPVAPDGYVPNSVVRMIVKPPPPLTPPQVEVSEWNYSPEDGASLANSTGDLEDEVDSERVLIFESDNEISDEEGRGRLASLSDTPLSPYYQGKKSAIEFDEDFVPYQRQLPGKKTISFRKLGNTLVKEVEVTQAFQDAATTSGRTPRIPRYGSAARVVSRQSEAPEVLETLKEEPLEEEQETKEQEVKPPLTPPVPPKVDLKAILAEQRTEATKPKPVKVEVHPLLKEISQAPWFRKMKLTTVTATTVTEALLEIGNTTRVNAHQKACEYFTKLIEAFGPDGTERDKDTISEEVMDKLMLFLASFMTPRYSLTGVESEEVRQEIEESNAKNPNRILLVQNVLNTTTSINKPSMEMACGLMRLAADANDEIRGMAITLLMEKLKITSWKKLAKKLRDIIGVDIVIPPGNHKLQQDEVLRDVLRRIKQGLLTLANAPHLARRLNLRIAEREETPEPEIPKKARKVKKAQTPRKKSPKRKAKTPASGDGKDAEKLQLQRARERQEAREREEEEERERKRRERSLLKRQQVATRRKAEPPRIPRARIERKAFKTFPRINWKKAVPQKTLHRINIVQTLRRVYYTTPSTKDRKRAQKASRSKRGVAQSRLDREAPKLSRSDETTDIEACSGSSSISLELEDDIYSEEDAAVEPPDEATTNSIYSGTTEAGFGDYTATAYSPQMSVQSGKDPGFGYAMRERSPVNEVEWRCALRYLRERSENRKMGADKKFQESLQLPRAPRMPRSYELGSGSHGNLRFVVHTEFKGDKTKSAETRYRYRPLSWREGRPTRSYGESSYGYLSVKWASQQSGCGMTDFPEVNSATMTTAYVPHYKEQSLSPQQYTVPLPTPATTHRQFPGLPCWPSLVESHDSAPTAVNTFARKRIPLYQTRSKYAKKLLKSLQDVEKKKTTKLPKISSGSLVSRARTIEVTIPSCTSSLLFVSKSDIVE